MTGPELLNAKELAAILGIKHSTFAVLKRRGQLRMFEVSRPFGQRRYSRQRVERYLAGDAMNDYGRRRA